MDKLPKETFIMIMSYLDSNDKFQCIFVCRQWYNMISKTNLYQDLILDDTENFYKAYDIFAENEYIGQQVTQLQIKNCDLDMHTTLSLPDVFPSLKKLIWIAHKYKFDANLPSKVIYNQQLKKWNQLEHIETVTSNKLPLATLLLESSVFSRLTHIQMKFERQNSGIGYYSIEEVSASSAELVQSLVNNLKNAPALAKLVLINVDIDLQELETLHQNTPNLTTLKLEDFSMHSNFGVIAEIQPASTKFKNVIMDIKSVKNFNEPRHRLFTQVLKCWLDYISNKYHSIETLKVNFVYDSHPMPLSCTLEGYAIKILSNMPNISCYKMRFCPITDTIMNAMDNNNATLKTIDIWTEEYDMERQFNFVLASKQKDSITSLTIMDLVEKFRVSPNHNSNIIINLVTQLNCLTQLTVNTSNFNPIYNCTLLIEIIKRLPRLEMLSISSLFDDLSPELDINQITETKLKDLNIGLVSHEHSNRREYINQILQFVLLSSPFLEDFYLFGKLACDNFGPIKLDFTNHDQLRMIDIDVDGVVYYLFGPRNEDDPLIPHATRGYIIGGELCKEFCKDKVFMDIWWNNSTTDIMLKNATTEPELY